MPPPSFSAWSTLKAHLPWRLLLQEAFRDHIVRPLFLPEAPCPCRPLALLRHSAPAHTRLPSSHIHSVSSRLPLRPGPVQGPSGLNAEVLSKTAESLSTLDTGNLESFLTHPTSCSWWVTEQRPEARPRAPPGCPAWRRASPALTQSVCGWAHGQALRNDHNDNPTAQPRAYWAPGPLLSAVCLVTNAFLTTAMWRGDHFPYVCFLFFNFKFFSCVLFILFIFYWGIAALQCRVSFCCTVKWWATWIHLSYIPFQSRDSFYSHFTDKETEAKNVM